MGEWGMISSQNMNGWGCGRDSFSFNSFYPSTTSSLWIQLRPGAVECNVKERVREKKVYIDIANTHTFGFR